MAGKVVDDVCPVGLKMEPHFNPSKRSRLRLGNGGVGDVAILLWYAPDETAERRLMGFLRGVIAAKRDAEACVMASLADGAVPDAMQDIARARALANPECLESLAEYARVAMEEIEAAESTLGVVTRALIEREA